MAFRNAMLAAVCGALAASAPAQVMQAPDITKQPTLYVVPYAHLDTQWRWDFQQTISEYLLKTMRVNFDYIEKYPHYVFNWTGANRYRLMKEYYPDDYARMKEYIARGALVPGGLFGGRGRRESAQRRIHYPADSLWQRLFPQGVRQGEHRIHATRLLRISGFSAIDPGTCRHQGLFDAEAERELAAGANCWRPGISGRTPEGIPFNVGLWKGPDGSSVIAALNPGRYGSRIRYDLSKTPPPLVLPGDATPPQRARAMLDHQDWPARIELNGKTTGVYADYHYIGIGDNGGASDEETAKMLEAIVTRSKIELPPDPELSQAAAAPVRVGDGPVRVISSAADQMFNDIKPEMTARMPVYQGDLELINHSAGSLTSQAYHKRWNRKNEILADVAERASVAAAWMGGREYPLQRLNDAWMLVLGGQFHDTRRRHIDTTRLPVCVE